MDNDQHLTMATSARQLDQAVALPDIGNSADSIIVIYDGECNFCRAQVKKLNWFGKGRLGFVSLHDPVVSQRFPDLSKDELMAQMYVITPDGQRLGGVRGIRFLSRVLWRMWIFAPLLHIPFSLPIWQYLYDKIAKYRYLIAGKNTTCESDSCKIHFDK